THGEGLDVEWHQTPRVTVALRTRLRLAALARRAQQLEDAVAIAAVVLIQRHQPPPYRPSCAWSLARKRPATSGVKRAARPLASSLAARPSAGLAAANGQTQDAGLPRRPVSACGERALDRALASQRNELLGIQSQLAVVDLEVVLAEHGRAAAELIGCLAHPP